MTQKFPCASSHKTSAALCWRLHLSRDSRNKDVSRECRNVKSRTCVMMRAPSIRGQPARLRAHPSRPVGSSFFPTIFFGVSYLQHLQGRKVKGTTPAQDENENDRKTSRNQMDATHGQFHARRRNRVRGDTTTAEFPKHVDALCTPLKLSGTTPTLLSPPADDRCSARHLFIFFVSGPHFRRPLFSSSVARMAAA